MTHAGEINLQLHMPMPNLEGAGTCVCRATSHDGHFPNLLAVLMRLKVGPHTRLGSDGLVQWHACGKWVSPCGVATTRCDLRGTHHAIGGGAGNHQVGFNALCGTMHTRTARVSGARTPPTRLPTHPYTHPPAPTLGVQAPLASPGGLCWPV